MNKYLAIGFEARLKDLGIGNMEEFGIGDRAFGPFKYDFEKHKLFNWNEEEAHLTPREKINLLVVDIQKVQFSKVMKHGEIFIYINDNGNFTRTVYDSKRSDHNYKIQTNNCFRTFEEAKKHKLVVVKRDDM